MGSVSALCSRIVHLCTYYISALSWHWLAFYNHWQHVVCWSRIVGMIDHGNTMKKTHRQQLKGLLFNTMWYSPIQWAGEVLLVLMGGLVLICVRSRGCVAPHPHQEVNTGVLRQLLKWSSDSSPSLKGAGGRGSRVNTGSMVYYNHRCKQCSCITAINKSWRGSGLGMRLARKYGSNTAFNLTVCTLKSTQVCLIIPSSSDPLEASIH